MYGAHVSGNMQDMDHEAWLAGITADTTNGAAERAGITPATLFRQLKRGKVSAENVIAIARAYGRRAGDELVATGYLAPEDLEGVGVLPALKSATNKQLLEEIDGRMAAGMGDVFSEPVGSVAPDREDLHLRAVADSSEREDGVRGDESDWDA